VLVESAAVYSEAVFPAWKNQTYGRRVKRQMSIRMPSKLATDGSFDVVELVKLVQLEAPMGLLVWKIPVFSIPALKSA
jgi:hypothetical protein